jgi:hypothetical protein
MIEVLQERRDERETKDRLATACPCLTLPSSPPFALCCETTCVQRHAGRGRCHRHSNTPIMQMTAMSEMRTRRSKACSWPKLATSSADCCLTACPCFVGRRPCQELIKRYLFALPLTCMGYSKRIGRQSCAFMEHKARRVSARTRPPPGEALRGN